MTVAAYPINIKTLMIGKNIHYNLNLVVVSDTPELPGNYSQAAVGHSLRTFFFEHAKAALDEITLNGPTFLECQTWASRLPISVTEIQSLDKLVLKTDEDYEKAAQIFKTSFTDQFEFLKHLVTKWLETYKPGEYDPSKKEEPQDAVFYTGQAKGHFVVNDIEIPFSFEVNGTSKDPEGIENLLHIDLENDFKTWLSKYTKMAFNLLSTSPKSFVGDGDRSVLLAISAQIDALTALNEGLIRRPFKDMEVTVGQLNRHHRFPKQEFESLKKILAMRQKAEISQLGFTLMTDYLEKTGTMPVNGIVHFK